MLRARRATTPLHRFYCRQAPVSLLNVSFTVCSWSFDMLSARLQPTLPPPLSRSTCAAAGCDVEAALHLPWCQYDSRSLSVLGRGLMRSQDLCLCSTHRLAHSVEGGESFFHSSLQGGLYLYRNCKGFSHSLYIWSDCELTTAGTVGCWWAWVDRCSSFSQQTSWCLLSLRLFTNFSLYECSMCVSAFSV